MMQCYCKIAVILHRVTKDVNPVGLRAARVRENEERIVRAAHELFARDGYQATTLTAVADAAGVAHRTVYVRFGTKAALLKRVIDVALVGDLAPVDVISREWYRIATTAPTLEERIAAVAKGSARLMASAADVIAVAREAEPTEPLLAAAARAGRAATREAVRTFWTRARDDKLLPDGCDLTWLTDTTSALAHAETYLLMRETQQITPEKYEQWLTTTCHRLARAATPMASRQRGSGGARPDL
jgi:AcrR family transcriptional regulator